MTAVSKKIYIFEKDIIGTGAHKITFLHPYNNTICLKIVNQQNDTDIQRELSYRSVLEEKHKQSKLLPLYYGTIETNKGTAYVYERICDYDGQTSLTLDKYIEQKIATLSYQETRKEILKLLLEFKDLWFKEKIVTSNIELGNFMVQYKSKNDFCVRIVDNIGTPVFIPLAYYFDYFATKRAKKYWQRFLDVLKTSYPDYFSKDIINKLSE